ncbi:MAG: ORF6N domain-containing protein [Nitrospirae bacterium]|nr:ORF6N domain-containing protein [Nitrospirota bacterium]
MSDIIPAELIEKKIYLIRRQKVMLDSDLADLYGVETRVLNQAVQRNIKRFPDDFMFQLNIDEYISLRSQIVTLKKGRGTHRKYMPYAFTEQGVAMLSSVLKSDTAVQVNIAILRAFVKLREILSTHKELAYKLVILERKITKHDEEIYTIFKAIRRLMDTPIIILILLVIPDFSSFPNVFRLGESTSR